jgi:hypothetical protein
MCAKRENLSHQEFNAAILNLKIMFAKHSALCAIDEQHFAQKLNESVEYFRATASNVAFNTTNI